MANRGLMVITSRLTAKAQTTIPQAVRVALHLTAGDDIAYAIEGDRVVISRAKPGQCSICSRRSLNGTAMPTGGPMPDFNAWDVVKVPFPYTDRPVRQRRPPWWSLLPVSRRRTACCGFDGDEVPNIRSWADDVAVSDLTQAGLPAPPSCGPPRLPPSRRRKPISSERSPPPIGRRSRSIWDACCHRLWRNAGVRIIRAPPRSPNTAASTEALVGIRLVELVRPIRHSGTWRLLGLSAMLLGTQFLVAERVMCERQLIDRMTATA